jgi:ABC-2 type transport system permease protein
VSAASELAPAQRVRGPSALSGDRRRFLHLTLSLAFNDWKLRFFGSVLGYFWSLLRPLLLFGILYVVFSEVVRIGGNVEDYPVQLLLGVILFTYFGDATGAAVESVVDSEMLVRKVAFPRMVIPLSVTLTASFNLMINVLIVGVFLAVSGVSPRWEWLLVPFPIAVLVLFSAGVAMLVSALYVLFRDVRPIWDVVLQALFYATPIFYPIEAVISRSETLARVVMANPVAAVIQETRYLLLGPPTPGVADVMGSSAAVLVPLVVLVVVAVLGFVVFNRLAPYVAEAL